MTTSTFASLAVRNYRLYFWGQSVSVAGTWLQNTALGWLVLDITSSGTAVGAVLAIRFLPILVLGPYGGLLADRMDGRSLMSGSQIVAAASSAGLATVVALGCDPLWSLYLLALGLGLANAVANPVRQTLINNMVPGHLLPNAVALNSISANVARVVGPLLSGVLIAGVGTAWCFAIDSASFLAVVASMAMMRAEELHPTPVTGRAPGQLRAGFRYLRGTPAVALPMVMVAVVGTFAWEFQVTLPLVAKQTFHGGAWVYGSLLAATGLGATAAGFWIARERESSIRAAAMSATGLGVSLTIAAVAPTLWCELIVLLVVGWGTISFNVRAKSLLQLRSAPQMRGRVMAIWAVAWQGTTPIGGPIVGWLGQHFGARWSLVGGALPTLAIGAGALVAARLRGDRGMGGSS